MNSEHLRSSPRRHLGNPGICHNKLARVPRHFDHVIDTQVMLSVVPCGHGAENHHVSGATFIVKQPMKISMQP